MKHIDRLYKISKGIKAAIQKPREIKAALRRIDAGVDSLEDQVDNLQRQIDETRIRIANGQDCFKELVELVADKAAAEEAVKAQEDAPDDEEAVTAGATDE